MLTRRKRRAMLKRINEYALPQPFRARGMVVPVGSTWRLWPAFDVSPLGVLRRWDRLREALSR